MYTVIYKSDDVNHYAYVNYFVYEQVLSHVWTVVAFVLMVAALSIHGQHSISYSMDGNFYTPNTGNPR